jgi:hypothetical protein
MIYNNNNISAVKKKGGRHDMETTENTNIMEKTVVMCAISEEY